MDDDKPTTKRPRYLAPRVKVSLSQVEADRFKAVRGETSEAVYCRQAALRLTDGCLSYATKHGPVATRRKLIRLLRTLWYGSEVAGAATEGGTENEVPSRPTRYERTAGRQPLVSFKPHQLERIRLARYGGDEQAQGVGVIDLASFVYVATMVTSLHDQAHRDELADLDALEGLVAQAGTGGAEG